MLKYFLAFNRSKVLGAVRIKQIINCFGDLEKAWQASKTDFLSCGLSEKIVDKFYQEKKDINPDYELELLDKLNIKAVCAEDEEYPDALRNIPDHPVVLYYKGKLKSEYDEWSVAVIGTRKITNYGKQATMSVVGGLVKYNIPIVSGLALGIDGQAHKVCVENNARTIAVLGSGIDNVYPSTHYNLASRIADTGGCVISEFPPGTPGYKSNFPYRNRIIAGLSKAVVVIEADVSSGSLITAKVALDYNKDVFALPGSIFSTQSRGTNQLIKQGAYILTEYDDIVSFLNIKKTVDYVKTREIIPDNEDEKAVIDYLKNRDYAHIDEIRMSVKMDTKDMNSLLMNMQLKGKIVNTTGMYYALAK